jgi:hypothetical protein
VGNGKVFPVVYGKNERYNDINVIANNALHFYNLFVNKLHTKLTIINKKKMKRSRGNFLLTLGLNCIKHKLFDIG